MEQGTPRQLPKNDWETVINVLREKGMEIEEFVYPERHRSQEKTAQRERAIRLMAKRGVPRAVLTTYGPYTRRHIDRILANGAGTSEVDRELPFDDSLLSLPPSAIKEALEPNTRQGQNAPI